MSVPRPLKRNLAALLTRDPELARRVERSECDPAVMFMQSRSGHLVPSLSRSGHETPLHSRFDPLREGERTLETASIPGYLVVLGLGAGYHLHPVLNRDEVESVLVIERGITLVRSIMERVDLSFVLEHPKIRLLVDAEPQEAGRAVLEHYLPLLDGNIGFASLASRVKQEQEYFRRCVDAVRGSATQLTTDYAVQARFGKRWLVNTLTNMERAESSDHALPRARRALVTGAGPSLETQLPVIRSLRRHALLIASDTSLGCLLAGGIEPDVVLSIDCQQASYHHFLSGYPPQVPLVLDLASPPVLTRLTDRLTFFTSGHPLSRFMTRRWRTLPRIDTSGGNVAHAAVSLARVLGATEVRLFGADFSFPRGKPYARGTYIYPYFHERSSRPNPLESLLVSFVLQGRDVTAEGAEDGFPLYTNRSMLDYRRCLEELIARTDTRITVEPGQGLPVQSGSPSEPIPPEEPPRSRDSQGIEPLRSGPVKHDRRSFLHEYRSSLLALDAPRVPFRRCWQTLSDTERELWLTQLPAAAALRARGEAPIDDLPGLLVRTRDWVVSVVQRFLD